MSFVPVTGRGDLPAGRPAARERRGVHRRAAHGQPADPRGAAGADRAHARDDVHPSVGLLAGAALLGAAAGRGGQVRARRVRAELADGGRSTATTTTGCGCSPSPRRGAGDADDAEDVVRQVLDAVADAMPRSAPVGAGARRRTTGGSDPRRSGLLDPAPASAWPSGWRRRPTTGPSWCGSRCGSRPTRRSWSPAPSGWCSRCTTSRTRCTSATRRCCGPSPGPEARHGFGDRARTHARSRCGRRPTPGRCSTGCSSCGCPTRSPSTPTSWSSLLEDGVGALQRARRRRAVAAQPRPRPDRDDRARPHARLRARSR